MSVAEVGGQERWQTAVLGVAVVSGTQSMAREAVERIEEFVQETAPDVVVTDVETDVLDLS